MTTLLHRARPRRGAAVRLLLGAVLVAPLLGCSGDDETAPGAAPRPPSTAPSSEVPLTTPPPTPSPTPSSAPRLSPRSDPRPDPEEQARLDRRLVAAAWQDDIPQSRRLIAQGADVNFEDETQQSAFLIATSEGYLEMLRLTLRHGADVNAKDSFNGTGLIRAAERGHWHIVGRLVQAGTPLDHVNNLGWTALHEAIILGDGGARALDTVRVLVAAGADVRLPSQRDGVTPRQHATSKGYEQMAELLAEATRSEQRRERADQDLLAASRDGDADAAALALRSGARLEARDRAGRTSLLLAVTHGRLSVARLLTSLGASPDALDDRHDTPWLVTGVTGDVEMAELLLANGPDLTIRNRFGGVSVIPASERGHVDYVRWVVGNTGIDVDHVNDLGWTALLEAVILGDGGPPYQQIVRTLLDAGADPTIPDADGVTALEHANSRGQGAVADILRRALR